MNHEQIEEGRVAGLQRLLRSCQEQCDTLKAANSALRSQVDGARSGRDDDRLGFARTRANLRQALQDLVDDATTEAKNGYGPTAGWRRLWAEEAPTAYGHVVAAERLLEETKGRL